MDKYDDHSNNLIVRVTEYGLKCQRFKLTDLKRDLNLSVEDFNFVRDTLTQLNQKYTDNPNHILVGAELDYFNTTTVNVEKSTYSLLPTAFYNYVDYLEIKQARIQANEAKKQSMIAIRISVAAIIVTVVIEFLIFFLDKVVSN
jgi:hypothetical protein